MAIDLNQLIIREPCQQTWQAMHGDGPQRFCSHCEKNVHNLAELTGQEIDDLLQQPGDHCVRIRKHVDGAIVTRDAVSAATTESPGKPKRFQFSIAGLLVLMASSSALFASIPWVARTFGPIVERWRTEAMVRSSTPAAQEIVGYIEIMEEEIGEVYMLEPEGHEPFEGDEAPE